MSDDINLFEYINDLRKESKMESDLLHRRISDMKDELMAEMKAMRQEQQEINYKMEQRVSALEKWKWTLVNFCGLSKTNLIPSGHSIAT